MALFDFLLGLLFAVLGLVQRAIPWPLWFPIPGSFIIVPAYPDNEARYEWFGFYSQTGDWDYLKLTGQFPYGRYFSFNLYNASSLDIDSVYDSQMVPDVGSINPFQEGADRSATNRDYTLWVVRESETNLLPPGAQTQNILRLPADVGNWQAIATRLYRTNKGTDSTGGVSPPTIEALKADGSKARFPDYGIDAIGIIADSLDVVGQVAAFRNVILEFSGENEIVFIRDRGQGVFPNFDTAYIFTALPSDTNNEVAVITLKPPTFVDTFDNTDPFQGKKNVRYWSFCVGSVFTTTSNCLVDDESRVGPNGNVTIVVAPISLKDEIEAKGYNFLGYGLTLQSILIYRNILADPGFVGATFTVPAVDRPADEIDQAYFDSIRAENFMNGFAPGGMKFSVNQFRDWLGS